MKKPEKIGIILLVAFMGILSMPLLSAPAAPNWDHHKSNVDCFENGDEHTTQWLIRSISDSEEFNVRTSATGNFILLFTYCVNYHSRIHRVLFTQTKQREETKLPKERIYLSNSCFTI